MKLALRPQILMILILVTQTVAEAKERVKPQLGAPLTQYESSPNQSFLSDTQMGVGVDAKDAEAIQERIYGEKLPNRLSMEYQDLNRDYEMKQKYGLITQQGQLDYQNKNSEFGKYMLRNVFSYQMTESLKKAEKNSEEVRTFNRAQQTVQSVIQHSSSFKLSDDFKFGAKTDLPAQQGRVWVKSFLFDANVDAKVGKGFSMNPMNTSSSSVTSDDKLHMNMSRSLGVWGLMGATDYGFTTTRMNHSVSKSITPSLSAELATTHGLDAGKSGMPKAEQSVRMNYGFRF